MAVGSPLMRVWIDQDLCTGDGLCVDHCPDVFVQLEDGTRVPPAEKLEALDALQYARIHKTAIVFEEKFWKDEDFDLITDLYGHYFYHATKDQGSKKGALIAYVCGDKADVIGRQDEEFRRKVVLETLLRRRAELGIERVWLLIRAPSAAIARARLEAHVFASPCFSRLEPGWQKCVEVLAGDLLQPGLGLEAAERQRLCRDLTHAIHCAASIDFDLPLPEAARVNAQGALEVLELLAPGGAEGGG